MRLFLAIFSGLFWLVSLPKRACGCTRECTCVPQWFYIKRDHQNMNSKGKTVEQYQTGFAHNHQEVFAGVSPQMFARACGRVAQGVCTFKESQQCISKWKWWVNYFTNNAFQRENEDPINVVNRRFDFSLLEDRSHPLLPSPALVTCPDILLGRLPPTLNPMFQRNPRVVF